MIVNPPATGSQPAPTLPLPGLLLWYVLVVIWLTAIPFPFGLERNVFHVLHESRPLELLANFCLLAPVGVAIGLMSRRRAVLGALCGGALLSAGIEVGQLFLHGRIAALSDILLNAAGAAAAAALALRVRHRLGPAKLVGIVSAAVFIVAFGHLVHANLIASRGIRLADWNPHYEVLAGNEVGGARQYVGRISEARICAGAGAASICAGAGADLETRRELVALAERSQQVSLSAHAVSDSDTQSGPTRIVTFSGGTSVRNITLGQQGTDLLLRIRTILAGPNGSEHQLVVPGAIHAGVPNHVHAQYRNGGVRISTASPQGSDTYHLAFTPLNSVVLQRGIGRGGITPGYLLMAVIWGAAVLALPVGLLAGSLTPRRGTALLLAALAAVALLLIPNALLGFTSRALEFLLVAAASAVGVLLGFSAIEGNRRAISVR